MKEAINSGNEGKTVSEKQRGQHLSLIVYILLIEVQVGTQIQIYNKD